MDINGCRWMLQLTISLPGAISGFEYPSVVVPKAEAAAYHL
jgi:hypothetical protein